MTTSEPTQPTTTSDLFVDRAERWAIAFARILRKSGVDVPIGSTIAFAEALREVGVQRKSSVYWAGRATFGPRPEDRQRYDDAFAAFWLGRPSPSPSTTGVVLTVAADAPVDGGRSDHDEVGAERQPRAAEMLLPLRYSPLEALRNKDFAQCTPAELTEARRLMADVRVVGARRRSRRLRPVRNPSGAASSRHRPDIRRTTRHALRTSGETVRRAWLRPSSRPRRIVLLCDVSGSMEVYARALLRFLQVAVAGRSQIEAFAIGTRLTRLTRELSSHDPDDALRRAAAAVPDWAGGTRLGDGLRAFNDRWGIRGLARGAVVVVLSDGWDRGDPGALAEQMERLHRVAHRVVWVNPLKASTGYAPVARGMAAALPYVDDFVEGHSLASLEQLVEVIGR